MKNTKKLIIALFLAVLMMLSTINATALPIPTGEVDGSSEQIYEGVTMTKLALEGTPYGKQKVNIVEFDLAQRDLYVEILKGDYIVSKKTMENYVKEYNTEHASEGKEVICAVNGDLWMTGVHSNTEVTTSVLQVPRGVLISEGIIYCSSQIKNEATYATNGEGHSTFWAFGITDDYVPMIGKPIVNLAVNNTTKDTKATTKAFNRLPAHDSLVIYNGDCNYSNYALEDAYEVVLTNVNGEFRCNGTVKGTVSAIYNANDSTSPTLTKDSVVLTARGTAIDKIKGYELGDNVEIAITITDNTDRGNDWSKAVTVIGGHIPLVLDGASQNIQNATTGYPSTIVGYKNDGTIVFIQNDGRQWQWSTGFSFSTADDLMVELGINSAINLDGGGSSTMIVGEELVNKPSDGSQRAVINGIALIKGPEREAQAEFETAFPYRFNARYLNFAEAGAVKHLNSTYSNNAQATAIDGAVRLTATVSNGDPYIYYDASAAYNKLTASKYGRIVLKYRTNPNATSNVSELFLCSGAVSSPTAGASVTFELNTDGEWHTEIIDLTSNSNWSGQVLGLRLDFFGGGETAGDYMDLAYLAFSKSAEEAEGYAKGTAEIPQVPAEATAIVPLASSGYKVQDNYLLGVKSNSTAYILENNVNGTRIEIYDDKGVSVRNGVVCTGYTICSHDIRLNVVDCFTVIVSGDANKDGKASSFDATMALKYDVALIDLDALQYKALDLNYDGVCNSFDAYSVLKIDAGLTQ